MKTLVCFCFTLIGFYNIYGGNHAKHLEHFDTIESRLVQSYFDGLDSLDIWFFENAVPTFEGTNELVDVNLSKQIVYLRATLASASSHMVNWPRNLSPSWVPNQRIPDGFGLRVDLKFP